MTKQDERDGGGNSNEKDENVVDDEDDDDDDDSLLTRLLQFVDKDAAAAADSTHGGGGGNDYHDNNNNNNNAIPILSSATRAWLRPQIVKERAAAIQAAEAQRWNLFDGYDERDNHDNEDDEDLNSTSTLYTRTLTLPLLEQQQQQQQSTSKIIDKDSNNDSSPLLLSSSALITFPYACDAAAAGHGNVIWGASLAMCLRVQHHLARAAATRMNNHNNATTTDAGTPFSILEVGAGTAIPSLYAAHVWAQLLVKLQQQSQHKQQSYQQTPSLRIHVTDAPHYANLRQILLSIVLHQQEQPSQSERPIDAEDEAMRMLQQHVQFRVSPHAWGQGLLSSSSSSPSSSSSSLTDDWFIRECQATPYNLVLASDCIYNPQHHDALLATLAAVTATASNNGAGAGIALVTFSLHGNVDPARVYEFFDKARICGWWSKVQAVPPPPHGFEVPSKDEVITTMELPSEREANQNDDDDRCDVESKSPLLVGWHMQALMERLGIWRAHLDPQRGIAYVYELHRSMERVEQLQRAAATP